MDFEKRRTLPQAHLGYMQSGVDDDLTLRANREGCQHIELRTRRLIDVSKVFLGQRQNAMDLSVTQRHRETGDPAAANQILPAGGNSRRKAQDLVLSVVRADRRAHNWPVTAGCGSPERIRAGVLRESGLRQCLLRVYRRRCAVVVAAQRTAGE
jgi:hypothetical protein